jgi:predicted homoserine dehydrogenase-like protein
VTNSIHPPKIRVGVVGTGFIARRLFDSCRLMADLEVSVALTRRAFDSIRDISSNVRLTHSRQELIDRSDVVVECSGDPLHAAEVVRDALAARLPVVTMNSEFHATCGSFFVGKGYLTEANGDQPGVQAQLRDELVGMGFEPMVYGNMKGFLNENPSRKDMEYWSAKQGFRVQQTTSFTDGTKVQIEQAFVANAFGADIVKTAMLAPQMDRFEDATNALVEAAMELGHPIADFTVVPGQAPGVFVIATIDKSQRPVLAALKMGEGPYYTFVRPYHLCALEIPNTIRRAMQGQPTLLDNSAAPTVGVAAVAKRRLDPGEHIDMGIGSFQVRGVAVRFCEEPDHTPIGLLYGATITRRVEPGQILTLDDVDLPDSYGRDITLRLVREALARDVSEVS